MQTTIFATKDNERSLGIFNVVISPTFAVFQQFSQSHNSLKIVLIDANESPQ